jgi:ATP-dependent RNA helicase DDX60
MVQDFKSAFTFWHLNGELLSGREAIAVIILSKILLKDSSTGMKHFVAAFLVHMVFLKHCSLSQRSCSEIRLSLKGENDLDKCLKDFSMTAIEIIDHWPETDPLSELQWDIFDLVDGRLLRQILANLSNFHSDKDLAPEISDLAKCVTQLTGVSISELLPQNRNTPVKRPSPPNIETTTRPYLVLPFKHPILDDFLADVRLEIDDLSDLAPTAESLKVFQEVSHWHNAKYPIDPKHVPKPKGFFARKKNQRFMADTIAYSASLTNSTGKQINPEIIVVKSHPNRDGGVGSSTAHWREDLRKIQATKNIKKMLQPMGGKGKALETAHARQAEKLDDKSNAVFAYCKSRCQELQREEDLIKRYLKTLKLFSSLSETDVMTIGAEVSLHMCNTLALIWRKSLVGSGRDSESRSRLPS